MGSSILPLSTGSAGGVVAATPCCWPPDAQPIKLTPRKALAEVKPQFDTPRMRADIEWLASPEREGRGAGSRGLDAAANYIAERFERLGLSPLIPGAQGGDRYFQPFAMTGEHGEPLMARNVNAPL